MSPAPGLFIVLEGADGSGKSTQARRLVEHLTERGRNPLHVRDPGTTRLAEGVRALLLDPAQGDVCVQAETFLYLAARAQLVYETIGPALAAGRDVICERWTLSTEVYQGLAGGGRAGGLGADVVRDLASHATRGVEPHLVVVFDVQVGEGLARVGPERDRMEAKSAAFHADVVRGYRDLATGRPGFVVVPPGDLETVTAVLLREVGRLGV